LDEDNLNENNSETLTPNNKLTGNKFSRSNSDFVFWGLCGGLGEYQSFDPTWLRSILLLSVFLIPWVAVVYIVASLLLPKSQVIVSEKEFENKLNSNKKYFWGILFISVSVYYFLKLFNIKSDFSFFYFSDELIFSLLFICAGFYNLFFAKIYSGINIPNNIFVRSLPDKKLLGVCSGFSKYLNIDVLILRMVFILLAVMTLGLIVLVYFYIAMKTQGSSEIVL